MGDLYLAAEVREEMPTGAKVANSDPERSHDEPELDEDTGGSEQESDEDEDADLPTFEFRFETAKLLIELDDKIEAATKACTAPWALPSDLFPSMCNRYRSCSQLKTTAGIYLCLL